MNQTLRNAAFGIAEFLIRMFAIWVTFTAVLHTLDQLPTDTPGSIVFASLMLSTIALIMIWQSKKIAADMVDIVRNPPQR